MNVAEHVIVSDLCVGDHFEWCGRDVLTVSIEPAISSYRRGGRDPGQWVTVEVEGKSHRLHYWSHEFVRVITPGKVEWLVSTGEGDSHGTTTPRHPRDDAWSGRSGGEPE